MKKRILSLVVVIMSLAFLPIITAHARAISADEMKEKLSYLRNTYFENYQWNDSFAGGIECWGFAHLCYSTFFDENLSGAYVRRDVENLCVGDWVRFRSTPTSTYNHSIFITNISGDTVYYVDCNANGDNRVHWDKTISKWDLQNKINNTLSGFIGESGTGYIKTQVDNWVTTLDEHIDPIHQDTNPHVRNGYCTIKNVSSGKFMNVYAGSDANYTSVCMWSYDDSTDQHFRLDHKGDGRYKLYAYCSSRGTNRVVDVYRGTDDPAEGDKIQLWTPDDDISQLYYLWPVGNDEYVFELESKPGYVIAPNGSGDAGADGAQMILQRYTGEAHQKWKFCDNNGEPRTANISYAPGYYTVNTRGYRIVRRNAPDPYADVISGCDINDGETVYVSQVNDFWGYTEFNGVGGWICLDYTAYTVVLDSISIVTAPKTLKYYTNDKLDSTGLTISANYSNGQKEILGSGFELSYDFSTAGKKNVIVSYKGKNAVFSVDVLNRIVESIGIYDYGSLKHQYSVGEKIEEKISILASYNNGSGNIITEGYDLIYDFSTPGTKTVTVSYGGKTTSYDVEVMSNDSDTTEKASFIVSTESGYSGAKVIVPVRLNASDIYDGNMTIQYDASKLSIENVQAVGALSDRQVTINKDYAADKIRVSFSGTTPINSDGTILNLEFKTRDNAQGTASVSIAEARAYTKSGGAVSVNTSGGQIQITSVADNADVTNIQSVSQNGRKVVTANVSDDRVMCYLAAYQSGVLVECDSAQPSNGTFEVSVEESPNTQYKLMIWNMAMKPMMNAVSIY